MAEEYKLNETRNLGINPNNASQSDNSSEKNENNGKTIVISPEEEAKMLEEARKQQEELNKLRDQLRKRIGRIDSGVTEESGTLEGKTIVMSEEEQKKFNELDRVFGGDLSKRKTEILPLHFEINNQPPTHGRPQSEHTLLINVDPTKIRYDAAGRPLPKEDTGVWSARQKETDGLLAKSLKPSGNIDKDRIVRNILNPYTNSAVVDENGCLILRREPLLNIDYTEEGTFRDGSGNLVKRKLPKGNSGRIALLNQRKIPYLHMMTTEFSTILWGDVGDETLLDPVPPAIEERAFELFQEEHKFPELATEEGEKEFRLKYIPMAVKDLESKFNSSAIRGYVSHKISIIDPFTQKPTESEEYIRFQEHCWNYLRHAHRLRKNQKFFPHGAAVRISLEEPKGLLKLARLREMAMRRLHREHQVRTVYMGETVGGKPVDIMTYHTPIPWKNVFEYKTLEEILDEVLVATLRELKFCYENFNAIHRDIKPSNLILPVNDVLKILDWGIVKFSAESSTLTRDFALGTPAYMSPEQIRREPLDFRSDICSLGWTMYAILSGKEPLPAVSSPEEAIGLRAFGYTPLTITRFDRVRSDLERRCKGKGFFERRKEYSKREEMLKNLEFVLAWMCQPMKELRPGSYDEIIDAVIDVYNGRQPKTLFEFLKKLEKTIPAYLTSMSGTATKEQFNAAYQAFAYIWKPRVFLGKVFSQKEQVYVRPADLGEELAKTLNYKPK